MVRKISLAAPRSRAKRVVDMFNDGDNVDVHCCACHRTRRTNVAALMARLRLPPTSTMSNLRALLRCLHCGARLTSVSKVAPFESHPRVPPAPFITEVDGMHVWSCGTAQRRISRSQAERVLAHIGKRG